MRSGKRRGENLNSSYKEKHMHRGYEFWSRRPYFGEGKLGKMMTHRVERRRAKREAQREASFRADLADLGYEKDYGEFKFERKVDEVE